MKTNLQPTIGVVRSGGGDSQNKMRTFGLILLGTVCLARTVTAQTPGVTELVDQAEQRRLRSSAVASDEGALAGELYADESADVGPQSILRLKPRRTWVEAQADVQYFYTDNLFQSERTTRESGVVLSTVQASVAPTAFDTGFGRLAPRVGYRQQWFSFGLPGEDLVSPFDPTLRTSLDSFDFNVSTVFSDLAWTYGQWMAQAGFDYQRLLDSADYHEFYREYVPRWRVQYTLPLGHRSAAAFGLEGYYRFTHQDDTIFPEFNDRLDHAFYVNYTVAVGPQVMVQPFYRFKYTRYNHQPPYVSGQRNDYLHSFGVGLYWLPCANFSARLFAGYDIKDSDAPFVDDYHRFDAGGGVNLSLRF